MWKLGYERSHDEIREFFRVHTGFLDDQPWPNWRDIMAMPSQMEDLIDSFIIAQLLSTVYRVLLSFDP
jgi:hypothetical protein